MQWETTVKIEEICDGLRKAGGGVGGGLRTGIHETRRRGGPAGLLCEGTP